jgi:superfamily II DNA or RNA helicase
MRRAFSKRQHLLLAMKAGGKCEECGIGLTQSFHADHVVPYSKGGKTVTKNGAALCPQCNLKKGNKMKFEMRPWQTEAIKKASNCYTNGKKYFAINAAPGTGKTMCAIHLAKKLKAEGLIDRVILIAPRNEIVNQWMIDFKKITGKPMTKVTGSNVLRVEAMADDIASTWAGIRGISDIAQAICESSRVLVIADEVHHAALEAAWGVGANTSMEKATYVLALSGTPIRSDGESALWLEGLKTDDNYIVKYEEAVNERWCVPVSFHRHHGQFEVNIDGNNATVTNSYTNMGGKYPKKVEEAVRRAIKFEKLVKVPMLDANGEPRLDSYHSTMLDWANIKLDDLRSRKLGEFGMPNAGGLVIAPNIDTAEYFAKLIKAKWPQEKVTVVHSAGENGNDKIDAFRKTADKWIVSVNMVSEGVDIHRLRVLVFLPMASTELYFRQAIGRVIRKQGAPEADNSRAYVIMPELENFVEYAKVIEKDMEPANEREEKERREKKVSEPKEPEFWHCNEHSDLGCGSLNPVEARECQACGMARISYATTLEEAKGWREGVLTRGEEVEEMLVKTSEEVSGELQKSVIKSGNTRMMRIMQLIPEEMYGAVEKLFIEARKAQHKKEMASK